MASIAVVREESNAGDEHGWAWKMTEFRGRDDNNPGMNATSPAERARRSWVKRLGVAGFAFFLIKGLLWLVIPPLIALGLFG